MEPAVRICDCGRSILRPVYKTEASYFMPLGVGIFKGSHSPTAVCGLCEEEEGYETASVCVYVSQGFYTSCVLVCYACSTYEKTKKQEDPPTNCRCHLEKDLIRESSININNEIFIYKPVPGIKRRAKDKYRPSEERVESMKGITSSKDLRGITKIRLCLEILDDQEEKKLVSIAEDFRKAVHGFECAKYKLICTDDDKQRVVDELFRCQGEAAFLACMMFYIIYDEK